MEKLFHFDCPTEVYRADACVLACFDHRFDLAMRKFLGRRGIGPVDQIRIPGGAKALAAPDRDSDRDFVLAMTRTSLRLHRPERMLIFGHNECGAYPGAAPETVAADVIRAAAVVRSAEPSLSVECYFCDFDGIYRIS